MIAPGNPDPYGVREQVQDKWDADLKTEQEGK